jgi:hypothetical protein
LKKNSKSQAPNSNDPNKNEVLRNDAPANRNGPHFLQQYFVEQIPFLGVDHVRRILEPDQLLGRRQPSCTPGSAKIGPDLSKLLLPVRRKAWSYIKRKNENMDF